MLIFNLNTVVFVCTYVYSELWREWYIITRVHTPPTAPTLVRVQRSHVPTATLTAQNNSLQKKRTPWLPRRWRNRWPMTPRTDSRHFPSQCWWKQPETKVWETEVKLLTNLSAVLPPHLPPLPPSLLPDNRYQSQLTLCGLDKFGENGFTVKVLKQKLWVREHL